MAVPDGLIERMTLREKIGQLTMASVDLVISGPVADTDVERGVREGRIGSLFNLFGRPAVRAAQRVAVEETRLGVPLFFGFDVIHGFRTIFPIPLAEACAFDPALWEATARIAAVEAAAEGVDLTFAPMIDVSRDPRWGRIAEGPGEDPLVGVRLAAAKVRGYRGGGPTAAVAVTAKHFVAYGASVAGRDYAPVDISERTLAEVYLPPFHAAIVAGAEAVMPAFTDVEGTPMTAHHGLLTEVLRGRWGFRGVIISDYKAIAELMLHGVAADLAEAAALALNAGVDIDMMGFAYERGLPAAVERGLVGVADIDAAVARVLDLKDRLGLFEDPYLRSGPADAVPPAMATRHRAVARAAAGRSLVVLRNAGGLLPYAVPAERLAVIGPLADAPAAMLGPWSGAGRVEEAVGVLGGLRAAWPASAIEVVRGVPVEGGDAQDIAAAVAAARRSDRVILCLGEAAWMSGEAASRARIDLPGRQAELAAAVLAIGAPVTVLLFSGRPIAMPDVFDRAVAVVACWLPGTEAGHAVADLLTGRIGPSARLAVTWPRHVGQVPIHYAARAGGRPEDPADRYTSKYLDLPNTPQFAFGHGLAYGPIRLDAPWATVRGDAVDVVADVANEGDRLETVTVFLFVRDLVARVARPILELRDFKQIALPAGAHVTVTFRLARTAFGYLGDDLAPTVEPGEFLVHVGLSADPADLRTTRLRID